MRVIAGSARSVPLYEVRASTTRPMSDRVKTSLFSILMPHIPGAQVVDLFAGTGSLGIEALSRGAAFCTFVERDRACVHTIARNLERTKLAHAARLLAGESGQRVRQLVAEGTRADLVFLDPPFRMGKGAQRKRLVGLGTMIASGLLAPDGLLVYHHEFDAPGDLEAPGLVRVDQRAYGRNVITLFRRGEGAGA